jgi:hypothetical protein
MAINFNKYAEEGNLFVTKGEFEDIVAQLPKELEEMIREGTHH